MRPRDVVSPRVLLAFLAVSALGSFRADAGEWLRRRRPARPVVPAARTLSTAPPGQLGTFVATPYIMVNGGFPNGNGYTPLDMFGDMSMSLYGPLSSFRTTAAPVRVYSRGYDGRPVATTGTSFSTPNLPEITPVIYPTQATHYFGPRVLKSPPGWANASTWVDQN